MSTSSTVAFYKGYYAGGTPTVLSANPFDVAQDLSTGNLWQYTGAAWVAPSWQTSITFWLGAADTVCARLNSPDTRIPDTIQVYYGTDDQVPPELNLSADDVAIHHGVGNYNLNVNVLRKDVTTDTFVDVPFPEGYVITTEDGNWTVLKNFNKCVGYDYATVSLAWTTTADGQGPQSVDYVTSSGARVIAEDVMSSGGGVAPIISGGNGINVITSGGSSTITLADIQEFGEHYSVRANDASVTLDNANIELNAEGRIALNGNNIHLNADDAQINGYAIATEAYVNSAIGQIPIVSGAIISGAEFVTQVGDYTLSYTSGGFTVAGSGEDSERNTHIWFNTYDVGLSAGDEIHDAYIKVDTEGDVVIAATGPDRWIEMIADEGATLNGQQVATQPWVEDYVSSHDGPSGAIIENQPFNTTVGDYTVALASGGLVVSGGGVQLQVSSGGIVANGSGGSVALIGGAVSAGGKGGGYLMLGDPEDIPTASVGVGGGAGIEFDTDDMFVHGSHIIITCEDVTVNSRPVATQLFTSESPETVPYINVLSGGTSFVYTEPLYSLEVVSVVKTTEASFVHFALDSVTAPTPVVISGVSYLNSATFEGGKEYLVGFFDGMCAVNEVTSGGVLQ